MVRRRVLVVLLLSGGAFAQNTPPDTSMMFPGLELPDPISWLSEVHAFVIGNGFHTGMTRIGWALLFVGFLVGLSRVAYYASEAEWWAVYGRLLLGVIVLANVSPIQRQTLTTWNTLYTWSSNLNGETVKTDLEQGAKDVGLLLGPILIVGGGAAMFGGRIAAGAAAAGNAGIAGGANVAKFGAGRSLGLFTRVLMYAFLPVFSIYAALVFLSGLTILLGMLLLPLAGAMVVFPGGLSWWSRWFGMITGSLVNILVLPILFNIVILLGMLGPMDVMQNGLQKASTSLEGMMGGINGAASLGDPAFPRDPRKISGWLLEKLYGDVMAPVEALPHVLGGWILSLVALIMGMLIALYLMRNFDRVITGFMGGIAAGIVPALGGSGGSGRTPSLGGGASGGGGGASVSASSGGGSGGGGSPALGAGGGGDSALATASAGGIRSARGGGGDDAVIDVEWRAVDSLPSGRQGALGPGA